MRPKDRPPVWLARADDLDPYSPAAAEAFRCAAKELEEDLREAADEKLTVEQGHQEGGYSTRQLRQMIADGRLKNVGRKGAPRIRRADLPRKPRANGPDGGGYDVDADAISLAEKLRP